MTESRPRAVGSAGFREAVWNMEQEPPPTSFEAPTDHPDLPDREELQAELLDLPEPPEQPKAVESTAPDLTSEVLGAAIRYVRAKRGGDLLALLLVGSGARQALTAHSDLDLIAVIKGQAEGHEVVRIATRLVDVRYRGQKAIEQELRQVPRLPPLLRRGRVLFDLEGTGAKLVEKANQIFRQGPPPLSLNEKIRVKVACAHWLGKAEDLRHHPATAQYLLGLFLDDFLQAFFQLRNLWPTPPSDALRFISSRDWATGALLGQFLTAPSLDERLSLAQQLVDLAFQDVPNPPRVD